MQSHDDPPWALATARPADQASGAYHHCGRTVAWRVRVYDLAPCYPLVILGYATRGQAKDQRYFATTSGIAINAVMRPGKAG